MENSCFQVDILLAGDTLPKYTPPASTYEPNPSSSTPPFMDAPDFSSAIVLPPGLTHVSRNVSIFAGDDLLRLLDPTFLAEHSIDQILLLRDQQSCGGEGDLIGTCSRLRIEGVTLVNWDLIARESHSNTRNDLMGVLHCRAESWKKVVVCGAGPNLIDLALLVMCYVEQVSEFEALLAIKRETI